MKRIRRVRQRPRTGHVTRHPANYHRRDYESALCHFVGRQKNLLNNGIWMAQAQHDGSFPYGEMQPVDPEQALAAGFCWYWRNDDGQYMRHLRGRGKRLHNRVMRRFTTQLKAWGIPDMRPAIKATPAW